MNRFALVVFSAAVVLPGVVLGPVWLSGGLGASEDDVLYYYPVRWLLAEFWHAGALPALDPLTGLKRPLLADPQAGVFYPSTWLFALLPPRDAYAAGLWLHASLAVVGGYRLLRAQSLRRGAALFGAVVFAFGGFMLAHRAHYTMQHAAAWLPLVFWSLQRWHAAPSVRRMVRAVVVIALQALAGHVQIAALTGLGALVWLIARDHTTWRRTICGAAGAYVLAFMLCALQALPTLHYLLATNRAERGYFGFVENSYNPVCFVTWVFPMLLGQRVTNFFDTPWWGPSHQVEQFAYIGLAPLLLAFLAIRPGWTHDRVRRSWLILAGFALLLALGLYGPLAPLLYWIPGASVFRVPARALVLVQLAGAVLAARTLHDLAGGLSIENSRLRAALLRCAGRPLRTALLAAAVCVLPYAAAAPFLAEPFRSRALSAVQPWNATVWVPVALLVVTLVAFKVLLRQWRAPGRMQWIAALVVFDLAIIGWTLDVPPTPVTADPRLRHRAAEQWLEVVRADPGRVWVVVPRRGHMPGEYIDPLRTRVANINILDGVASVTHYGPLHPRRWQAFVPFEPWGELRESARWLADATWRARVDLRWIVLHDDDVARAGLPAPQDAEHVLTTEAGVRLYRCLHTRGRAYLADAARTAVVRHEQLSPTVERTHVSLWDGAARPRPARLVLANVAVPGWRAFDEAGEELPLRANEAGLLEITLAGGAKHTVHWRYEPAGLNNGKALSAATATALLAAAVLFPGARRRLARRPAGRGGHAV